jgi:hypothetical protein
MSDEDQVHLPIEHTDEGVKMRVGNRSYMFKRTMKGTLVYSGSSAADIPDETEDESFDPTQYR